MTFLDHLLGSPIGTDDAPPRVRRRRGTAASALALTLAAGIALAGCGAATATPAAPTTTVAAATGTPSPAATGTPSPAATGTPPPAAPAPGHPTPATGTPHMVTHDGHRLAFYVTPGTLPAIVLDAGGGNDATYWNNLVPPLSRPTGAEIVTYDREGMGRSQEVPGPFSAKEEAADLAAGLTALGISGRTVLVSHSETGEIALNLVNDDPGAISGAVLVDASLPEFYTPKETARIIAANEPTVSALKKEPRADLTQAQRQLLAVAEDYGPEHAAFHALTWPSSLPVTVIASGTTPMPPGPDADAWRAAQAAFASAGPHRTLVTATGSSHDVPLDAPGLVIDQVAHLRQTVE